MGLLVPDAGKFAAVEQALTADTIRRAADAATWERVALGLPRFKSESKVQLRNTLMAMGMPKAFTYGDADFSGIDDTRLLYIGQVVHQTFISVDEKGTEAAAATAVVMRDGGMPAEPQAVTVDRPFLYVLRDTRTGQVLFMGRMMNPAAASE